MGTKVKHGTRRRRKGLSPSERYCRKQFRLLVAQMNVNTQANEQPQPPTLERELRQTEQAAHQAELVAWRVEEAAYQSERAAHEAESAAWRVEMDQYHAEFRVAMNAFNEYMDTHFPPR